MGRSKAGRVLLAGAGCAVAMSACIGPDGTAFDLTDDIDETRYGSIEVAVFTTGAAPDADGYVAAIDESQSQPIGVNGSVTFASLPQGYYSVRLDGKAPNCTVAGTEPVPLYVFPDTTVSALFNVDCP